MRRNVADYIVYNKYFCLVFSLGLLYTLLLQTFVKDEVFFSGDGGLKALLTRQFSRGEYHVDLRLPSPLWVKQLWNKGLYPFQPPFVYVQQNRRYVTFDFLFPLLSSPFYKWFGFRGLRIVPLISTWLIWVLFYIFCKGFELDDKWRALALAVLIFSSNLTIYSAMFWEHTFAVWS